MNIVKKYFRIIFIQNKVFHKKLINTIIKFIQFFYYKRIVSAQGTKWPNARINENATKRPYVANMS